jgi:hypothetical protein
MNVTMRSTAPPARPDIYISSTGEYLELDELDRLLRSLQAARRWLIKEQKVRAAGGQASPRLTVKVAK